MFNALLQWVADVSPDLQTLYTYPVTTQCFVVPMCGRKRMSLGAAALHTHQDTFQVDEGCSDH